jgi:outer membrane protein assembly factor BamB
MIQFYLRNIRVLKSMQWLFALTVIPFLTPFLIAADPIDKHSWPNWLGPHRNGISYESGWKDSWPETGLPVVWSAEIGVGFSSIAIVDHQLFTMGHVDGQEIVWCLDAKTGAEIWTHRYPSRLIDVLHEGGPAATPTIDGERVYTLGKEGQLFCLDRKSGDVIWETILTEDLDVPIPEWGFAASPVIAGDQLILEGGRVVSYDKTTGKKNWQTDKHRSGYGSAAIFTHGPQRQSLIATLDNDGLRINTLDNGDEIAFKPWSSPYLTNATTPIIEGDRIYISTAYNVGCGLFEFDGRELKRIYSNRQMKNHFNNSVLFEGHLYGMDGNSNLGRIVTLTCMKLDTGDVTWKQQGMGCGSLLIADGKLLILSESGELILAKATPSKYEELGKSPFLHGRCWTVPVLVEKHVYGRNATGKLVCVELPQ